MYNLIQRQLPLGREVTFVLAGGQEVSGILAELGREHVTIEAEGGLATLMIHSISAWRLLAETEGTPSFSPSQPQASPNTSSDGVVAEPEPPSPPENVSSIAEAPSTTIPLLISVRAKYDAVLDHAQLSFDPAALSIESTATKGVSPDLRERINRLLAKLQYAEKINELSPKFGRIQPIRVELRALVGEYPRSPELLRLLAYCECLLGDDSAAITYYRTAIIGSERYSDWHNLAAVAARAENPELARASLEKMYAFVPLDSDVQIWHAYMALLVRLQAYNAPLLLLHAERQLSPAEVQIIFETGLYFLQINDKTPIAADFAVRSVGAESLQALVTEAFDILRPISTLNHTQDLEHLPTPVLVPKATDLPKEPVQRERHTERGVIYNYREDRNYGFLKGEDGTNYFFHRSAIIDEELAAAAAQMNSGETILVVFEPTQGPKGPLAVELSLHRSTQEIFDVAIRYAENGDYPKAISHVKRILSNNPTDAHAKELYNTWREYARISTVPTGSNPYARAKRAQIVEKDWPKAAHLFAEAIRLGDTVESAVKDLATMLADQLERIDEAIEVLLEHRTSIRDQRSVENMLITFYYKSGRYADAIILLHRKLARAANKAQEAKLLWQLANTYLRQEDPSSGERYFRRLLELQPDNLGASRNLAICLFKQQHLEEAQQILSGIVEVTSDAAAADLLRAIREARETGHSEDVEEIIIESVLSDFSAQISGFSRFFLEQCKFEGVPRLEVGRVPGLNDVRELEAKANRLGNRASRVRAECYLSAAKITSMLEDEEDPNVFYRYLCKSFASMGDAAIESSKLLDSAREFYAEALAANDGNRTRGRDQHDAANALVRFLYSTLGQAHVPLHDSIPTIDDTIADILARHPQRTKVFDAITYLVFRSRYAANKLLHRLFSKSTLQALALEYLVENGVTATAPGNSLDDFVRYWYELRRRLIERYRTISNEMRVLRRLELTTASLEYAIPRTEALTEHVFFDLDRHRLTQIQRLLQTAVELCKEETFEAQENLCSTLGDRCGDFIADTAENPTKVSVEELVPVVANFLQKVMQWKEELYSRSEPHLSLRLPIESYTPDAKQGQRISVQIVIENQRGRSPAESIRLFITEDPELFRVEHAEVKLDGSLRGGDKRIIELPIRVSDVALSSQAFSLPLHVCYRTRNLPENRTPLHNFSIRLYPEQEFTKIDNPYAAYAEGGIVGNPDMFFGRGELITNVARTIRESTAQSKCIVIFGQKRAGKSSILHHLREELLKDPLLITLDIGNIGAFMDEHSKVPLLYQILWQILARLDRAVQDRMTGGYDTLPLAFPQETGFYSHPSPLSLFGSAMEEFHRNTANQESWRGARVVLLIDEFSYVFSKIVSGAIPETFMKNWKALLQSNHFSAVLVGPDVMAKFKQRYPNEFGTTQDERVTYLAPEDARSLIDVPIRMGGPEGESRYRESSMNRILDLTAGSPYYIQIVCSRLVQYMNRKKAVLVTEADVEHIMYDLIRGVNALDLDKFENLINSGDDSRDALDDADVLAVLTQIAANSRLGPCRRQNINVVTKTSIDAILDDLVRRDVVERERSEFYRIRVRLFEEWLNVRR